MRVNKDQISNLPGYVEAECTTYLHQLETGRQGGALYMRSAFPYLCGKCAHIHLVIVSEYDDVRETIMFQLTQEEADKLAMGLQAPGVLRDDT